MRCKALLFFLLSFFFESVAQTYHFVKLTVEDGLSQNEVLQIIQDKRGLIWFATKGGGVSVFDGVNYTYLSEDDGLNNNIVYCLHEDIRGNIWIGTYDGLNMFDGSVMHSYTVDDGLSSNVIRSICEDASGKIWIGTENGGVSILSYRDGEVEINAYKIPIDFYIGNSFRKIIETSDGKIWLAGNKGLTLIDGVKATHFSKKDGLGGNYIYDILEDVNGDVLIATNNGLSIFDGSSFITYGRESGFPTDDILTLAEDQKGNIWLGTAGDGLIKFNPVLLEYEVFSSRNGLSEDIVLTVLEDISGNIWIGTKGGGVNRFSGNTFTYFTEKDGLPNEKVNSITVDRQNNIWFATREGLVRYDHEKYDHYTKENGLPVNFCNVVFEDDKGVIWVGTLSGLAKIVNGEIMAVYTYSHGLMNPVKAIIQDSKGVIWLGTDGGGIVKFEEGKFTTYSMINGLNSNKVTALLEDDEKTLWIGTFGGGVSRFNGYEFLNLTKEEGISSNIIYSLAKSPRGEIFIGTKNGINRFEKNTISLFTTSNSSLSSNNIKMMAFDEENTLWVGSEKGLDRIYFNPPQVFRQTNQAIAEIKHYGKEDGIKGGEINPNAVAKDVEGNMWFGSNRGAIKFNANLDDYNTQKPKTYITDLKIDYNVVDWKGRGYQVIPWSNIPQNLVLPYDTSHVTFRFIGINHKAPDKVRYQWKLEGFDQSFTPLTTQNTATYPNLPPGKYEFKVIACNSDEECSDENPAVFVFEVAPPFWRELWFMFVVGLVLLLLIFGMIKWRERKLHNQRLELEDKVKERTQEVLDKNKELELVNLEIISKNKEIEEKNEDLNSSIRYALTIQQAYFPPLMELNMEFGDAFIYHVARDIVSGDFYWFRKWENKFVLVVADCTGHGVPGAFMSLIGMTLLNEIFSTSNSISAGEALNKLDEGVKKAFENSETESNDGMDIALCIIDQQNKTIEYSGAYRPLIRVVNNEIVELKATKNAIGGRDDMPKKFETLNFTYQNGECLYLFSDGYPDQFGGPSNKKFKTKVMKEMLLEIHHKPMQVQKELIHNRLLSWMRNYEQVDDILVAGIRL